ncbi:sec-independent protein translocase protein TATB, chloroplastic-like isoform X2 [Phoenix dactylifera]|uniref:Sec-independent protein translocase protein TATB, chloroplastic-like isoform X2 n=1 Tax=Phoenix dactylifera TaxID=42345 RepID=A0A8B8J1A9_PHODC|nr:sec-independent protein translocase protein TATB, chloroplastic-like isoform X2 [Phoenix dactylifera]
MGAATAIRALRCCPHRTTPILLSSSPPVLSLRTLTSRHAHGSILRLGFPPLPPWIGLKHIGVSFPRGYGQREKKGKYRGKVVYASLFGVGAPEALVIGVVALLVFGPKGLAEVARNLGKTLRAFQPTLKELQEVSKEFKSTLEREIGLDEVASSTNYNSKPTPNVNENQRAVFDTNGKPSAGPYTSEELLKITEDQQSASTTRTQTEAPTSEEQPQASSTSEVAAANPSETTASAASETAAQVPSYEKAENDG